MGWIVGERMLLFGAVGAEGASGGPVLAVGRCDSLPYGRRLGVVDGAGAGEYSEMLCGDPTAPLRVVRSGAVEPLRSRGGRVWVEYAIGE